MRVKTAICMAALGLALAGCNRSINSIAPAGSQPQRLSSAPVEPVETTQLPDPANPQVAAVETTAPTAPTAPNSPAAEAPDTNPAPVAQPSGEPVTHEGVSGAWVVASDNPECRMILAFTKMSGGYRAATRRCTTAEMSSVSAWDVKGQQVVLMDAGGNTIARLYHSGGERYDGTTNSGNAVSFTR